MPNAWLTEIEYFFTDVGTLQGTIVIRFRRDSSPTVTETKTFTNLEPADIMNEIVAWATTQSIVFR